MNDILKDGDETQENTMKRPSSPRDSTSIFIGGEKIDRSSIRKISPHRTSPVIKKKSPIMKHKVLDPERLSSIDYDDISSPTRNDMVSPNMNDTQNIVNMLPKNSQEGEDPLELFEESEGEDQEFDTKSEDVESKEDLDSDGEDVESKEDLDSDVEDVESEEEDLDSDAEDVESEEKDLDSDAEDLELDETSQEEPSDSENEKEKIQPNHSLLSPRDVNNVSEIPIVESVENKDDILYPKKVNIKSPTNIISFSPSRSETPFLPSKTSPFLKSHTNFRPLSPRDAVPFLNEEEDEINDESRINLSPSVRMSNKINKIFTPREIPRPSPTESNESSSSDKLSSDGSGRRMVPRPSMEISKDRKVSRRKRRRKVQNNNVSYVPPKFEKKRNNRPDYANMDKELLEMYRIDLTNKLNVLRKSYPCLEIPKYAKNEDLNLVHTSYECYLRKALSEDTFQRYSVILTVVLIGIELFLTQILGLDCKGFAKRQIKTFTRYETVLRELSETGEGGEPWPLPFQLGFILVCQCVIYLVYKFAQSYLPLPEQTLDVTDMLLGNNDKPSGDGGSGTGIPQPPEGNGTFGITPANIVDTANTFMGGSKKTKTENAKPIDTNGNARNRRKTRKGPIYS